MRPGMGPDGPRGGVKGGRRNVGRPLVEFVPRGRRRRIVMMRAAVKTPAQPGQQAQDQQRKRKT